MLRSLRGSWSPALLAAVAIAGCAGNPSPPVTAKPEPAAIDLDAKNANLTYFTSE